MLTTAQKKVLELLKGKRRLGDIGIIAEMVDLDRSYVGKCLNPESATYYNERIVAAAKEVIDEHKRKTQKSLDILRSL